MRALTEKNIYIFRTSAENIGIDVPCVRQYICVQFNVIQKYCHKSRCDKIFANTFFGSQARKNNTGCNRNAGGVR